jgi:peptide/nickel transport system permease protein
MLQLLLALQLGLLPLGGRLGLMATPPAPVTHLLVVDAILGGQWRVLGDALAHAVLPTVTLCFAGARLDRAGQPRRDARDLEARHIVNARAQGVSGHIVARYALKNA